MASERETIKELRGALAEAQAELERIGAAGLSYGMIIAKASDKKLVVECDGKVLRIESDGKCKVGDVVWMHPMTMQIVEKGEALPIGTTATVLRVCDMGIEIAGQGGPRFVCSAIPNLAKGDIVLMDSTQTMAFALVEKAPKPAFAPSINAVRWDEIGGHAEAKRLLREAVEMPRKHAELYAKFGKKAAQGILLLGPPGCGKTLLARAVATSVGADKGGFLAIKGPEVLDPYVGVTEQTIRGVFRAAAEYKKDNGKEAVIFVDEAESLLAKRGAWGNYMGQTVVPTFLTEMDGLEQSSAIVILATNRPDSLDPAVVRDGRVDHKIEIKRPTLKDAESIFEIYLSKAPVRGSARSIAQAAAGALYGNGNNHLPYSGALIESIVDKAKANALRAIVDSGRRPHAMIEDDVFSAIKQASDQEHTLARSQM